MITYDKLEKVLRSIGYEDQEIDIFKDRFIKLILTKAGQRVDHILTPKQKEELQKMIQSNNEKELNLTFKAFQNSNQDLKDPNLVNQIFEEAVLDILELVIKKSPRNQRFAIKSILFGE